MIEFGPRFRLRQRPQTVVLPTFFTFDVQQGCEPVEKENSLILSRTLKYFYVELDSYYPCQNSHLRHK